MSKILVIDDDSVIRLLIKKALQNQGHEVVLAINGQEGIEHAQRLQPAMIICDWIMPIVDGLEVCRQVRANPDLSTTFFILLTARGGVADRIQGLDTGADDFLSKPINIGELQARVRAGLRLQQLSQDLQSQKQLLEAELTEAATYMRSLLPKPLQGSVSIDARFIPSRQLGGDCFDYFWLDPDYLVMYLLDVSGHGLGAALPSSLILNILRLQSLPDVNFYQPHDVLRALNESFQMSQQNDKYFTIWYGVYNQIKRQLTYASAGHPPAILRFQTSDGLMEVDQLKTPNFPIGMLTEATFVSDRQTIPKNSTLYIFSDGVYDISQPKHQSWGLKEFTKTLVELETTVNLDEILTTIQQMSGIETFDDDLSLLRVNFN
ncbi:MAG: SpoIIE family protein phosphatase [Timaviella obliquedivisa GSE-PSE-MK23-08B]|jgi:sigma-B regulation protein RsbU (phosphoserine phosphatase)|nr:SpoIIE family protein phosphatase [Timaviella obliquedivisa GSE-PSE-MK23-08B]